MFHVHPSLTSPWYLALLALVPAMWWLSFHRLAGLGRWRRLWALGLRTLLIAAIVLALAEVQIVRTGERLTVLYLLDQSLSVPAARRRAMVEYVNAEIQRHRQKDDRVGVIVFGREAAIEVPPIDDALQMSPAIESIFDPEYTNLAAAMKLAQATFPEDAAKRVVLASDGNQNLGNVLEQAAALASAGIGIDVVPVRYHSRADVAVERVILPPDVRRGQPFDLRIVLSNTCDPGAPGAAGAGSGEVRGRLVLSQLTEDQPVVLSDEPVKLPPGKKVFTVRQQIDEPSFYTYEARFIPDRPQDAGAPQNKRATAFTHVQGKGQVLVIEDFEHRGEHDLLVSRLRQSGLEVTLRATDNLFSSLADLQPFDTVVLANVPRATNEEVSFTDEQIDMLVRNTQQMGAGLVMLGGAAGFGAGGWTGTDLEKAMPVDFQIKNAEVSPRGALAMLMHASEIPQGNHIQKVIAREAIKALSAQDYCGVLHWNGNEQWLMGGGLVDMATKRDKLLAAVSSMMPGDMPDFEPAVQLAAAGFAKRSDAAVKHMIILSDGDPSPPSPGVRAKLKGMGVTVSTVAVGAHGPAESKTLSDIAADCGG
ncbi:MAG: VWA domain-containing protein, partial [Thermoguttaceae bacterium]